MIGFGRNISSLRAGRQLDRASNAVSQSIERLASGLRINRGSDDSAGLAISSQLDAHGRVFGQAVRNANDGISALNIADGALGEMSNLVIRLKELATQSASGAFARAQRISMDGEADALVSEYNRLMSATDFNGRKLLEGSGSNIDLQLGFGTNGRIATNLGTSLSRTTGAGTFKSVAYGDYTLYGAVGADVNNDGKADVLSSDGASGVNVSVGAGDGSFTIVATPALSGAPTTNILASDVNGDGNVDIVAGSGTSVSVILGNGNGTFKTRTDYTITGSSQSLVVADFNGDGKADIGVTTANSVGLIAGNGNGTFQLSVMTATGVNSTSARVGDFDGDGKFEMLSQTGTALYMFGAGPSGGFSSKGSVTWSGHTVEVADLNRDGLADLIGGNATGSLVTRFGNGNFTFRTGGSFTVPDQALNTKLADLNGDGNADVVFNGGSSNVTMYVMLGNADGTFGSVSTLASTAGDNNAIPIIMDFDGDGVLDIAASDTDAGAFNIFLGRSQRTTTIARLDLATQSGALAALSTLDATLQRISAERGAIGASLSRVSSSLNTLGSTRDNYAAASSRIKDVDVALETGELSRKQILQQSAQAILAQANQIPTLALSLLRDI